MKENQKNATTSTTLLKNFCFLFFGFCFAILLNYSLTSYYHSSSSLPIAKSNKDDPINNLNVISPDTGIVSIIKDNHKKRKEEERDHSHQVNSFPEDSFSKFINNANLLSSRINNSLDWIIHHHNPKTGKFPYIRWDLISNAEIHILYKLQTVLSYYLSTSSPSNKERFYQLYGKGYQCNELHAAQQELIAQYIQMDICSEIEWYKLAHLGFPQAKLIFDVGGNKGYLGALFLTLWGGGNFKSSPIELFELSKKLKTWKSSKNPAGYCRDGLNYGIPLFCPDSKHRNLQTGQCEIEKSNLHIFSFDGSSYLAKTITQFLDNYIFPKASPDSLLKTKPWQYFHNAVSSKEGKAYFTKQTEEVNPGYEGGSIQSMKREAAEDTEEVNVITVDTFMARNKLTHLDILKIDTEGNDHEVLAGATKAVTEQTGLFTFEATVVSLNKAKTDYYHSLNYSCYSTTRAGLFKWNQNCMKDSYYSSSSSKENSSHGKRDRGNIFCIHRYRAPLTALAFEILSFPSMIDFLFLQEQEGRLSSSLLSSSNINMEELRKVLFDRMYKKEESNELQLPLKVNSSLLVPLYINIYGFCKPWPSCLRTTVHLPHEKN